MYGAPQPNAYGGYHQQQQQQQQQQHPGYGAPAPGGYGVAPAYGAPAAQNAYNQYAGGYGGPGY
jgi:hypothetical protein